MENDRRVDEVPAQRAQPRERALFVGAGEQAIARSKRPIYRREAVQLG
jgi:hypothetical protein